MLRLISGLFRRLMKQSISPVSAVPSDNLARGAVVREMLRQVGLDGGVGGKVKAGHMTHGASHRGGVGCFCGSFC